MARKHREALVWRILARLDGGAAADATEPCAVRLAPAVFGHRCLNHRDRGQGMSSRDARALWADRKWAERTGAAIRDAFSRAEVRAKVAAASNHPEVQERRAATSKALGQTGERREQIARAVAASLMPEAQARRARTRTINDRWRRYVEEHSEVLD